MTDLNRNSDWPFDNGAEEIVIRVSRYSDDLASPAAIQAIVKGRDRDMTFGVGVRRTPVAALVAAIESFRRPKTPNPTADKDPSIDDLLA